MPNVNTKVPVQKTGVPFGPPNPRQKNRRTHSQVEGNNLQPCNSQHWVRLQHSVTLRTSSVLSTGYKPLPRERPRHICRGGESPCQRRQSPCLPHERGLSQSSIRDSKKYGTFCPVIDLSFLNKFVETHILNGEYLFPQVLVSKREPHDHFGLKGRIPVGSCPQGVPKVSTIPLEKQMLCLSRPLVNLSRRVNTGTPELVPGAEHIGNSSACTRQIEHSGRLWIEGVQRQQRVENWPVCFLTSRLPKYVSWRLDPEVLLADALTINWTTFMGYAFSPFHFILAVRAKCLATRQTSYLLRLSGKHSLGATSPGSSGRSSSPSSQHETPSNRPREPPKYTSNVSPITLSRVSHFRGQYQAMGLSNDVIVTVARL